MFGLFCGNVGMLKCCKVEMLEYGSIIGFLF
jgi:hypothetical protein